MFAVGIIITILMMSFAMNRAMTITAVPGAAAASARMSPKDLPQQVVPAVRVV
jgi:hypothetical protein